jgi:hypothetical protein
MRHYVDVDMVLDCTRNKMGLLCIPDGPIRAKIFEYKLTSKVLEEFGPGGGNPLVRLFGSKANLEKYLREVYCENLDQVEANHHVSHIKRGDAQ